MDLSHEDDNVVIWRTFECPDCGTQFECSRAEPFCIKDHPGQWHLQRMIETEHPCAACCTWRLPYELYVANPKPDDNTVVLYPPPGLLAD